MTITIQRLTCACCHVFDAETVTHAPIAVWIASVKALHCPKCGAGSDKLFPGGAHNDAPLTESVEVRAAWWKERGDIGVSSETIWAVFVGSSVGRPDIPHDPDDFSRCRKLLELIPEWRSQLAIVAARYAWWKPFVDAWEELDAYFTQEEKRKWKEPHMMYARMQDLGVESRQIRNAGKAPT